MENVGIRARGAIGNWSDRCWQSRMSRKLPHCYSLAPSSLVGRGHYGAQEMEASITTRCQLYDENKRRALGLVGAAGLRASASYN